MTPKDADLPWTERGGDHPSDLVLDELHAQELSAEASASVRAHLDSCGDCTARWAEVEKGFAAFAEVHEGALAAKIWRRQEAGEPSWFARFAKQRWLAVGSMAAAAAVVVIGVLPPDGEIRSKGGLTLVVHRERAGTVETLISGDEAKAGDRLRFEVRTKEVGGYLMVVGQERDGTLYGCYPSEPETRARPVGVAGVLPGAVELDESTGEESMHAIWCPSEFDRSAVSTLGGDIAIPDGCQSDRVRLLKR